MIFRDSLFKAKIPFLSRALDTYALRQKVISKNIANATTAGYKPSEVKFEELFTEHKQLSQVYTSDPKHIKIGGSNSEKVTGQEVKSDIPDPEVFFSGESHVNIDKEMSELAQNQIRFRFASRALKKYFQALQSSISGRM